MINIRTAINQHFVISKLKKQAKILHREQPEYSLMECQNKIAQNYGYLHWHELYTGIKNNLLKFQNIKHITTEKHDNLYIGKEELSNKDIYLNRYFNQVNIFDNQHTFGLLNTLCNNILDHNNTAFIYIKQKHNTDLNEHLTNYSTSNNIPIYKLSFLPNNDSNSIYFDFSNLSSGVIIEMLLRLFKNDDHGNMWTSRAINMAAHVLSALTYLKSVGKFDLTPNNILNALNLDYIINMYNTEEFPSHIKSGLKTYIHNLPGYDVNKEVQNESIYILHDWLQMQFTSRLNYLDTIYPYMFEKKNNTIEFSKLLEKQKKFILIVDLNKEGDSIHYNNDLHCFTSLFMNAFNRYHGNSTIEKAYKNEMQNQIKYYAYLMLDNINSLNDLEHVNPLSNLNKHNPLRLPVNTIFVDHNTHTQGIDIVPMEDQHIIIKDKNGAISK